MDLLARIESKIDALLKKQSIKWEEPPAPATPELTAEQKDAIANAPAITPVPAPAPPAPSVPAIGAGQE